MPTDIEQDLRRLWPLTQHFEYAAEIGLILYMRHAGWWRGFLASHPDAESRYPLAQAQGFQFLAWLEKMAIEDEPFAAELERAVIGALLGSPAMAGVQFEAALAALGSEQEASDPTSGGTAQGAVRIIDPPACRTFRTERLDRWTDLALTGAEIDRRPGDAIGAEALSPSHTRSYVAELIAFARAGGGLLTPETLVEPESEPAILTAAGSLCSAVDWAVAEPAPEPVLCRVHPGSHHAGSSRAGGGCLVNNLAIAARYAQMRHRMPKIAILDIDAHHGNGTEQIFIEEPSVYCVSVHQEPPFFPGTGSAAEQGWGRGKGANLNIPVSADGDPDSWRLGLEQALRMIRRFNPQLVLVELSTDAHELDPISAMVANDASFAFVGEQLRELNRPVVCELGEGRSGEAWVRGLRAFLGL